MRWFRRARGRLLVAAYRLSVAGQRLRRVVQLQGRRRRVIAVTSVGVGLVSGGLYLANRSIIGAARDRTFKNVQDLPERYTVIVLGAKVHGDVPSDVLEDRLSTALDVYRSGRAKRILVSGDHGRPEYDEANAMRRWLLSQGVPDHDVFMDHAGFRTLDTMARARQVFQVDQAIVVTQEFHLARALYLAEAMGIDAVGMIADRHEYVYATQYAVREALARWMCWLDVNVFRRRPRFLGEVLPITGPAASTYDADSVH